jgi:hypothetical protein
MLGTLVQVAAGLYYTIAGIYVFNKLDGQQDVVKPEQSGRPGKSEDAPFGFLAFQAGLHEPQIIPDSGMLATDQGAWTVKIPWEVHLRRHVPTKNLYDPKDSYWSGWIESKAAERWERNRPLLEKNGIKFQQVLDRLKQLASEPLPREAKFEILGDWTDNGRMLTQMSITFVGQEDFSETSMNEMRSLNKGEFTQLRLSVDGAPVSRDLSDAKLTYPVFFDRVYNASFGVMQNWNMGYSNRNMLSPVGMSMYQFRRWFDYENPEAVQLELDEPAQPAGQALNLDWW